MVTKASIEVVDSGGEISPSAPAYGGNSFSVCGKQLSRDEERCPCWATRLQHRPGADAWRRWNICKGR